MVLFRRKKPHYYEVEKQDIYVHAGSFLWQYSVLVLFHKAQNIVQESAKNIFKITSK